MAHYWRELAPRLLAIGIFMQASLYLSAANNNINQNDQGKKKVTVVANNMAIQQVFRIIEKQTGLKFFYNNDVLNRDEKVSINMVEKPLDEVLVRMLQDKGLTWLYIENVVRIGRRGVSTSGGMSSEVRSREDTSVTSRSITGKVTAADGSPIPGATVMVKGTNVGAQTDADGNFTVLGRRGDDILLIRSIGYETREIPIKGESILVQLNVVISDLDETVVIAYGTTTKRLSTGNVSTIKARDIEKQPVSNPLLALQGRVPGLSITQNTGVAGGGITVRLQGQNSLNRGSDPLYVIDGVPYISQPLPNISGVFRILGDNGNTNPTYAPGGGGNPLSFINPSDIESVDVLKDADATAIYGSRGANGVILITTKKGKAGKTKVDVNFQTGWGKVTRMLNLLNTKEYIEMRREAFNNGGTTPGPTAYDINGSWDTTRYTDWQKALIGRTVRYTDARASISGGNQSTQFLIGTGYHRETSVFPGDFADYKTSLHFNISNSSFNQKFKIQLSGNYLVDNNKLPINDLTSTSIRIVPNAPNLYNADGTLNWAPLPNGNSTWLNPLAYLNNKYTYKTKNLIGSAFVSYEILLGLEIKTSLGYTNMQTDEININPLSSIAPEDRPYYTRSSVFGNGNISSWIVEPQATYKHKIGMGTLEVLVGTTFLQNRSDLQQFVGSGYNSDATMEDIKAAASVEVSQSMLSKYNYNALFGRINYNFLDKYIINLTARRDGSSRFGAENLFHNFGSVAGAWIFSNEHFIKKELPFVSFGKLRISYGTTGNDQIGDYQFMNLYNPVTVDVSYQGATALELAGLSNPYLQWEETKKLQFGFDLGLFDDSFLFSTNYYLNRSSNQLQGYALPIITGFSNIQINFPATVKNSGWELSLSTRNLKTVNVNWTSNVNLTIPRNKLESYPGLVTSADAYQYVIGEPVTIRKVYHLAGLDPSTGIFQFTDSKGNVTSSPIEEDKTVLINTDPKFYGGFQNTIRYKGFELDFLFQFSKQVSSNYFFGRQPGRFSSGSTTSALGNQPIYVLLRWQKPGDVGNVQKFSTNYPISEWINSMSSDASYSDASYIRLKNVSVSWQLPERIKGKMRLQNARIFMQGQNLLTLTHFKGMDPETPRVSSLPPLKIMTLGIQVTL